jgi:Transposase DDE domain
MASVASALHGIKSDLQTYLPEQAIVAACAKARYPWRQRLLGPVQTIHLFILQVLNFNTAMTGLRHLSKTAVKAPAYCKARMRLPLEVLETLLVQSSAAMRQDGNSTPPATQWCGLRPFLVDGSSTIAPDTRSSQKAFGQPKGCKKGCGFPVPKVLGLFDAFSGLIVQVLAFPLFTHEQSKVWKLHPLLKAGDLLVGDRGFCSFVHLAMLFPRGIHGLFRIHQHQTVDFRPHRKHRKSYPKGKRVKGKPVPRSRFIRRLGKHDQLVEWFKSSVNMPKWIGKRQYRALSESLTVRELRFVLPCKGQRTRVVTIATTLLDPILYPKDKIAELYGVRWQVETHFAELKTTLKMRKLKSKTAQGIKKELVVYALVYNLVHLVMLRAAQRQKVGPDRISFIDTLRWLISAAPGEELPDLLINPRRPDRHEPRVVKDREDTYTKMTRPRWKLRQELKRKALADEKLK